jgi:hypothetical protein
MPEPFASLQRLLGLVSFDFLSPDCFMKKATINKFAFAPV